MGIILDKLQSCSKKCTMVDLINFKNFLEECTISDILEDFKAICIEPIKGIHFAKRFILNNSLSKTQLNKLKEDLSSVIDKMESECYENAEHLENIYEVYRLIDSKLINSTSLSTSDVLIQNMYLQELKDSSKSAEKYGKILSEILNKGISDTPIIQALNELLIELKSCLVTPNTVKDIMNISTLTSVFMETTSHNLNNDILVLLLQIPLNIVLNLRKCDDNIAAKCAYLTCFTSELYKIDSAIISGYQSDYLTLYKRNLQEAISTLKGLGVDNSTESVIESVLHNDSLSKVIHDIDLAIVENYYKFIFSENETVEESIEWFNNIVKLSNTKDAVLNDYFITENSTDFEAVLEKSKGDEIRKKVNVSANKIKSKVQKVKDKSRQASQNAKAVANHLDKTSKSIDNAATKAVNKAKGVYRNDIRGEIIENKTTIKLGRIIRKGILIGSLALVNPAIGAIGALTTFALRKKVKDKERRKIIRELEEELAIVNEKIEDAKGDADKEKKYQLMRIKNTLEKDIERIRFRMKADDKGV